MSVFLMCKSLVNRPSSKYTLVSRKDTDTRQGLGSKLDGRMIMVDFFHEFN